MPGWLQSVQAAAFVRNPRPTSSECAPSGASMVRQLIRNAMDSFRLKQTCPLRGNAELYFHLAGIKTVAFRELLSDPIEKFALRLVL